MLGVDLNEHIVRTLLYYEIFDHPLTAEELFHLSPKYFQTKSDFAQVLLNLTRQGSITCARGYYSLPTCVTDGVQIRSDREKLAVRRLRMARVMARVIKQFPFVRGVFLSGDLSKGVAHRDSDIDYVIVTNDALTASFQPLIDQKVGRGVSARGTGLQCHVSALCRPSPGRRPDCSLGQGQRPWENPETPKGNRPNGPTSKRRDRQTVGALARGRTGRN